MADNPPLWHATGSLLRQSPFDQTSVRDLKSVLFEQALGTPATPSRRNLYLVSALLGHLSPETTLYSYVHILDWLSAQEANLALQLKLKDFQTKDLAALCHLQHSKVFRTPFRALTERPLSFLHTYIARHWPKTMIERSIQVSAPADLSPIFAVCSKVQVPSPMRLIQALSALHFAETFRRKQTPLQVDNPPSERVLAFIEKSLNLPRESVLAAWADYLQLYAQQSGGMPKRENPGPPRNQKDQPLFWQILRSTEKAWGTATLKPILLSTAERLIQRQGPTAHVKIKLGGKERLGGHFVQGLQAMGIPSELIHIQSRMGPTQALFDVMVSHHGHSEPLKNAGLLKGINYAAVWIRFAHGMTDSNRTARCTAD
ncbi:MAG: hypothetical protein KGI52_11835 [Burkholderiales bacterium]|nr:hypothetical protein [Burkholderiales bacterium]